MVRSSHSATPTDSNERVLAAQAVYTKRMLAVYDVFVLAVSNSLIWKCPTKRQLEHYNDNVTSNHLDVGVGTGYFLDRCRFPSPEPRVALIDLNAAPLEVASRRIARYRPETYSRNVLEPISWNERKFDSVGINYFLHCLPGSIESKSAAIDHLIAVANPDAVVFGTTLLYDDAPQSWLARRLMEVYNDRGIFSNRQDDRAGLEASLKKRLRDVTIDVVGCAALFAGRV